MKKKYDIISERYVSNCFIEAIKAKRKNSKVSIYYCKPRITENNKFQMCHFMWGDGEYSYDFTNVENERKRWYQILLFKGQIRRFEKDFARKYSNYRNGKI